VANSQFQEILTLMPALRELVHVYVNISILLPLTVK